MKYIATCFSHYAAVRMKKLCESSGWEARLMPVPRALSSSCGICVSYEGDRMCPVSEIPEEVEQIVEVPEDGGEYCTVYMAEGL